MDGPSESGANTLALEDGRTWGNSSEKSQRAAPNKSRRNKARAGGKGVLSGMVWTPLKLSVVKDQWEWAGDRLE